MSRKTKNILMTVLIIVLITSSVFTIYSASKVNYRQNMIISNNGENPPEIPNGETNKNPNMENMEEPPQKPEGEIDFNADSTNQNQPPEIPNEPNNNSSQDNNIKPMDMDNRSSLKSIYYILFVIQSLGLSLIIMYLIMSGFNKKTLKETLKSSDKIIIYILSTVILTVCLTLSESYITKNFIAANPMNEIPGGTDNKNTDISYSAAKEITEDTEIASGEFTSDNADENAILASGNIKAVLSNITITKTGDSDGGDNTSFYGTNSAVTAKNKANLTLNNITVTTNATGANGVFSYGGSATTDNSSSDNTTITISDSHITTTKDNSGGIMTTGGGIMNAYNLTVNTAGTSSAAIRSDRGGGTVTVDGGTYTTNGQGSPAVYSTADITVSNAKLISKASEGIVIEGKNSVTINNCNLTDSNTKLNGQSTTYKNIFLYQSMSGDAASGKAEFIAKNSTITTNNGDSFYITNTTAEIILENNTITNNDNDGNFLRAQADSWGNSGSNGGKVTLTLTNQNVLGNITIDSISSLDMTMKSNSYYEGSINKDNNAESIKITLDENSKIKLTGDSYITALDNADKTNSNIDFNGYKLYVNGKSVN